MNKQLYPDKRLRIQMKRRTRRKFIKDKCSRLVTQICDTVFKQLYNGGPIHIHHKNKVYECYRIGDGSPVFVFGLPHNDNINIDGTLARFLIKNTKTEYDLLELEKTLFSIM